MSDEAQITALTRRWAQAVHDGDLDAVLVDHSPDIVMFDVPPPDNGVRGLSAYRETWPPFFEWQRTGASFEIVDWPSRRASMSVSCTLCCAAAPPTNWSSTRSAACGSRSGCESWTAGGW